MNCAFPIQSTAGFTFPCGQCMPCRINARRSWTARCLLEWVRHEHTQFVTLTYSDEHVPRTEAGLPQLRPRDLQLFLKRVRQDVGPGLRFFAVGEYGSHTQRPHYHLVMFGLGPEWFENDKRGHPRFVRPNWWPWGFIAAAEFSPARAAYISHYVAKKWTNAALEALEGRHPEFMRSSRRPGIGVPSVPLLLEPYTTSQGAELLADEGDVRSTFRFAPSGQDMKVWPVSRLLRTKMRTILGIPLLAKDRKPVPRDRSPLVDIRSAEEKAQAVLKHDRLVRRSKSHGIL